MSLIHERFVQHLWLAGGTAPRPGDEMLNLWMQKIVALEADRILKSLLFKKLINLRGRKRRIATEEPFKGFALVSSHDRLQHRSPIISGMNVSSTQGDPLHVPLLIEAEERMGTRSAKMPIKHTPKFCYQKL